MRVEESIDEAWSSRLTAEILNKLVSTFQGMGEDYLLSGDSGLQNVWEEICVQLQGEESADWDLYADTISLYIGMELEKLDAEEKRVLWLTTDAGWSWIYDHDTDEEGDQSAPVDLADITEMLSNQLMSRATDFESRNITIFLEGYDPGSDEDEDEDDEYSDEDEEYEDEDEDGDDFYGGERHQD